MFKPSSSRMLNGSYSLPAPIAGIDAASTLMQLPAKTAIVLENFFPDPRALITRPGYTEHVTGLANNPARFHTYNATTGIETLFLTSDSGVFDVTAAGALGSAKIALTSGDAISTSISTGAGNYLLLVNGVDTMKQFDGTTWSSVAVLGAVATSDYSFVATYRQRLFFVKKASLDLAYLAPNSISGAPTAYPFGAVFRQGGYIVAIAPWTLDSGSGPEDNLAIISSTGHIAVFAGEDPATWTYRGTYYVGKPLGRDCLTQYGGDILCLTETGIVPLSSVVQSASLDRVRTVSQDIRTILIEAAGLYGDNAGWQIIVDPLKPMVLVNIPSTPLQKQAVMHSQSQAWAFYSGWEARCFGKLGKKLYFATASVVGEIGGVSDAGANIVATMSQAYNRLGASSTKCVKSLRAFFKTTGGFEYDLSIGSDFKDPREETHSTHGADALAALWGTGVWGTSFWAGAEEAAQDWQTVPDDYSTWKSLNLRVSTNRAEVMYLGADILYTVGGTF